MRFRIDPLTDEGTFDNDFFASPFYESEKLSLSNYLMDEGFDTLKNDFIIDYRSRRWHVIPVCQSNRKKKK